MKTKIALTAILAILTTNAAISYTFDYNDTTGVCKAPDILETPETLTGEDPVQYGADWANNIYEFSFDANGGNGSKDPETCTYYDSNDTAPDGTSCDLSSGDINLSNAIVTSWNTESNGSGAILRVGIADLAELSNIDSLTTIDDVTSAASQGSNRNEYSVQLYAQWSPCEISYSDHSDITDADNNAAKHVTNITNIATDDNTCKYQVACANGWHMSTGETGIRQSASGDPVVPAFSHNICAEGNDIDLQWNGNGGKIGNATTVHGACTYGGSIDVPQPTRFGYKFEGWDIADATNDG